MNASELQSGQMFLLLFECPKMNPRKMRMMLRSQRVECAIAYKLQLRNPQTLTMSQHLHQTVASV
nr:hypothetical protein Itr_chr01CG11210 [Ipomoea trifida]